MADTGDVSDKMWHRPDLVQQFLQKVESSRVVLFLSYII